MRLPEFGICSRKCDSSLHGSAVLGPEKYHTAVLIPLRQLIGEQQRLSLMDRDAQKQQGAIGIYVQRVCFFMEGIFLRSVAIHIHGNVKRQPAASSPVGNFTRVAGGRFRLRLAVAKRLRMFQCFKNSAHFYIPVSPWRRGRTKILSCPCTREEQSIIRFAWVTPLG